MKALTRKTPSLRALAFVGCSLAFTFGATGCSTVKKASSKVTGTVAGWFSSDDDDRRGRAAPVQTQPVDRYESSPYAQALAAGAVSPGAPRPGAAVTPVATGPTSSTESREYVVGPGDQLDIEIIDDPTSRTTVTVGPDGRIYFYLMPGLDVWGMTLTQIRERLEGGMQEYFREARPISVSLRSAESERVWILGRVNEPGVYPATGSLTLLEAIALAGGPASASPGAAFASTFGLDIAGSSDESADLRRAFVMRDGQRLPVDFERLLNRGDLSQNVRLRGGDFIYLPSTAGSEISVLGAVYTGRNLPYLRNMTLVQAIAAAGGTIEDAHLGGVAIVRGSLANPEVAIVDYRDILTGQRPDVQLEPRDIVYVPNSPMRGVRRYVNLILDTFVRTVGVNEGARAIDRNAGTVGVAVPIPLP